MTDPKPSDSQDPEAEQPFVTHLVELRDRLIRAVASVAVVFIVLAIYPGPSGLFDLFAKPLIAHLPHGSTMIAIGVITPFLVPLKLTMLVALMVALPVVLYQLWAFVAPGLYTHEKRLVVPLIFISTVLFYLGVAFAYFIVLGRLFTFIQDVAPKVITAAPDIESYLNFVLTLFLAFGTAFEVPVVLILLVRFGVLTIEQLKAWRAYFIVVAFIIAAVITPPDVFSQSSLAVSMILLYEVGIVGSRMLGKYAQPPEEDSDKGQGSAPSA
ncbi:MAG: twin-arginine translocase subunit TatC [Betaproteobacteria bacterium]|nr:twin-arginine translocase subunit TatC [Betaproteobacteria bacterium]